MIAKVFSPAIEIKAELGEGLTSNLPRVFSSLLISSVQSFKPRILNIQHFCICRFKAEKHLQNKLRVLDVMIEVEGAS